MGLSRVIVVRAGGLGDIILCMPALQALRHRYPQAVTDVVGYPATWQVAGAAVQHVTSIDRRLFADLYAESPSPALQAWLRGADLVVAWTARDPSPLLRAAGRDVLTASPYPPPGIHAAAWLLQTISADPSTLNQWRLELSEDERHAGRQRLDRLGLTHPVVLHPGAGARWKRWPAHRFAALGAELRRRGHEVLLVEGPADREVIAAVRRHLPLPVVGALLPRDLAPILARAAAFVGNDSGVTHLAAAVGTPTLALFGPTDPTCWAPLGDSHVLRCCERRAMRQGEVRVCHDEDCLEATSLPAVLDAIEELAARGSGPA